MSLLEETKPACVSEFKQSSSDGYTLPQNNIIGDALMNVCSDDDPESELRRLHDEYQIKIERAKSDIQRAKVKQEKQTREKEAAKEVKPVKRPGMKRPKILKCPIDGCPHPIQNLSTLKTHLGSSTETGPVNSLHKHLPKLTNVTPTIIKKYMQILVEIHANPTDVIYNLEQRLTGDSGNEIDAGIVDMDSYVKDVIIMRDGVDLGVQAMSIFISKYAK